MSNAGVVTSDSDGHRLAGLTFSGTTIEAVANGAGIDFGNENVSTTGNLSSADVTSTGNASLNTATLSGLLTANGGITADGGVFTVANASGNVSTSGTLDVTGNFDVNGNFSVTAASGATTVAGAITATAQGSQIADFTFNNGSLTSATGTIDFGDEALTTTGSLNAGGATVTSLSVSDGNITNVGDISLDTISSDASTVQVLMDDNVAGSFEVKQGGNSYIKVDTTDGSEKITFGEDVSFTTASFSGDISLDAALTVDGLLTANAGITADNFTVADTSGNTQIGGTLVVTSTVTAAAQDLRLLTSPLTMDH